MSAMKTSGVHKVAVGIYYVVLKIGVGVIKKFPIFNKVTIGGVTFYGSRDQCEDFEKALQIELPKYDLEMKNLVLAKEVKFDMFYFEDHYFYKPEAGFFMAKTWTFKYGPEGVCQYIAYCIIGSTYTGRGLAAAIRNIDRKQLIAVCREKMRSWIKERDFPESYYKSYL